MKSLLLKIRFIYLGIKKIKDLNIGDVVVCNNCKFYLSSYKYTDTNWNDYWSMINLKTNEYEVHSEKDIIKIFTIQNIKNCILGTYRFYMINWYRIMKNDKKLTLKKIFKMDYSSYLFQNK